MDRIQLGLPSMLSSIRLPKIGVRLAESGPTESKMSDGFAPIENKMESDEDNGMPIGNEDNLQEDDTEMAVFPESEDDDSAAGEGIINPQACTRNRDAFREYVANRKRHSIPFPEKERHQILLLDVLRKNKAPLKSYNDVLDWHYRSQGLIQDHERVGQHWAYNGREAIIGRLAKRYGYHNKLPTVEKFYLPWSKAKVNVVMNDFCDQLEKILHDPRFKWDDFLFFDEDNPFAPPPENISTIGDINTGEAYLKTYEKLITNPKRQLLVPILFYIDGAVTGQYDKLKVESLQFCPGLLNYKAREQSYAWGELGYVANYNKEDSREKKNTAQFSPYGISFGAIEPCCRRRWPK